jgi:hypothetical protein
MMSPVGGGAGGLGAPIINTKTSMTGPLGGSAGGLGAPIINAKKHRRRPP